MRLQHTSQLTKIILVVELVLVAYLLYALTVNVYKSYRLDVHIKNFEEENRRIATENTLKNTDFLYYTSDQYIDKIAKQNFGLVNHGEEVIILPPEETVSMSESELVREEIELSQLTELSNAQKWWKFFFDR